MHAAYDALDTVKWMLGEARIALVEETYLDEKGREKKKSKARRDAERVRYDTLCEALWNIQGRPESLEELTERELMAA